MTFQRRKWSHFIACAVLAVAATACGDPDDFEAGSEFEAATGCSVPGFVSSAPTPVGFASLNGNTTGGGSATPQVVTSLSAFNTAAKGTTAAVIFVSGNLGKGTFTIGSNKTIVGCSGTTPTIGGHVAVKSSANVIIRNLNIVGFNCRPPDPDASAGGQCQDGQDAITVEKSHNIWFDHDAISDGSDGNLDIVHGSDNITVSYTKFFYSSKRADPNDTGAAGHRFSDLVGGSDSNGSEDSGHLNITWHHNWWAQNVVERQPRIRFGKNHLYNNLWTSSGNNYCIGTGVSANILVQNNAFVGVKTPFNNTSFDDSNSVLHASGNVFSNTSGTAPSDLNGGRVFSPPYSVNIGQGSSTQQFVMDNAGPK